MLVTWDTGVSVHESAIVVMANMVNTGKLYKWYGDRVERGESCKPRLNPQPEKWFFPDPRFPKVPQNGGRAIFFLHCHKKCQFCFTQEIKGNLNFAPKVFQTTETNGVYSSKWRPAARAEGGGHSQTSGRAGVTEMSGSTVLPLLLAAWTPVLVLSTIIFCCRSLCQWSLGMVPNVLRLLVGDVA